MTTGLLVTALAWVTTVVCLFLVAARPRPAVVGSGLLVVAAVNAVVAALLLRPWLGTGPGPGHGETWLLVAGALDLVVAAVGARMVHAAGPRTHHTDDHTDRLRRSDSPGIRAAQT